MINLNNWGEKLGLCVLNLMVNTFILAWLLVLYWLLHSSVHGFVVFCGFVKAEDSRMLFEFVMKVLGGLWGFANIYGVAMILAGWPNHIHRFFGRLIFGVFR